MWSLSVHLYGLSILNIICWLLWSTFCLSGAGQVAAQHQQQLHKNDIDQELLLTKEEKDAFDKFKTAVYANISHPFLKQDIYLLRWIRAKNLDVNVATRDMLELMDFLRKNNISDDILDEDWSDMIEDHPFHFDANDRQGRPVVYGSVGDGWNVRRTILQGKQARFKRYTYYIAWKLMHRFMEINNSQPNVTVPLKCLVLMDMSGFNVFQHSCPACITSYINLLEIYERYVPGYVKDIVIINASQAYLVLLEILRPVLSRQTRNSLKVFSTNKSKWKPYIDARIDPNQLPPSFGGNRIVK